MNLKIKMLFGAVVIALAACATNLTPYQRYMDARLTATQLTDQVVLANDTAVNAQVISKPTAQTVQDYMVKARDILKDAKTLSVVDPALAVDKVNLAIVLLTQAQLLIPKTAP